MAVALFNFAWPLESRRNSDWPEDGESSRVLPAETFKLKRSSRTEHGGVTLGIRRTSPRPQPELIYLPCSLCVPAAGAECL